MVFFSRGVRGQGRLMLLALVHRSISKVFAHVFPPLSSALPPETFVSRLTNDSALPAKLTSRLSLSLPVHQRECNQHCLTVIPLSFDALQCSVRCGRSGLQHRNVICRDPSGRPSAACPAVDKPASAQPCVGFGRGDPACVEDLGGGGAEGEDRAMPAGSGWRRVEAVTLKAVTSRAIPATEAATSDPPALPLPPQKLVEPAPKPGREPR